MRCTNCKAYVPFDSKTRKCPACGAPIDRKPFLEDMLNMVAESSADKNFIFWAGIALIIWVLVGVVDFLLGGGGLLDYFAEHIFNSLVLFLYWGLVVEHIAKANAQIRIASKTVILKERRSLRIFRMGTNLSVLFGLALSFVWIGAGKFLSHFPSITLITTVSVCLFWALEGMYFNEEHFEDHRVRNFFILLGVRHPHPYRVMSAWFISGLALALVVYWGLYLFPSIFWGLYNSWLVQGSIKVVNSFLKYFPTV